MKKDFKPEMVRRPRVVFRPGKALLELAKTKLKVERMMLDKNEDEKEEGGGDRPEIE